MLSCENKVISIVEGLCASSATLLSIVADERLIKQNSYMLIHQLSTWVSGNYREIEDGKARADFLMEKLKSVYSKYGSFEKADLEKLLKRDLYLSAKDCIDYGLVDRVGWN